MLEKPCKIWHKAYFTNGYGRRKYKGKDWKVHRLVWTLANGEIPEGVVIRHKCDNKGCYELTHLESGSQKDNIQDSIKRGRHSSLKQTELNNHMCKLSNEMVLEAYSLWQGGMVQREVAKIYNVTQSVLSTRFKKLNLERKEVS